MLQDREGRDFTTSWTPYRELNEEFEFDVSLKIYVPIEIGGLGWKVSALLDTGAPWTILGSELMDELDLRGRGGEPARLRTSDGVKEGNLERVTLTLLADPEGGRSVPVESTVFVCDWLSGCQVILGYQGFIQRLRIALDPANCRLHFGPY